MISTATPLFRQTQCKRCACCFDVAGRRGRTPVLCDKCKSEVGARCTCKIVCKQCGRTAWKATPQEFCSQSCNNEWQADRAHKQACKQCGSEFRCKNSDARNGRSFCSAACRAKAWGQEDTCECVVCRKRFRRRKNHKDKNLVCSKQCGGALRTLKAAANNRLRRVVRIVAAIQRTFRRKLRIAVCKRERERRAAEQRACLRCGKMFRNGKDKLCSPECRAVARRINRKSGKRSRKGRDHVSRCKERGLPYEHGITKSWVRERDRGTCMLCGSQTVEGIAAMAPTIGHIIPLNNPLNCKHGHVANNLFLNCAACNGKQGNAVVIDGHQNSEDPRSVYLQSIRDLGYPFQTKRSFFESPTLPMREFLTN